MHAIETASQLRQRIADRVRAPSRERPVFDSVRHALMFSFRMAERDILSAAQCYAGNPTFGAHVTLTDHEWHAQAAQIRATIERHFDAIELALILADYGAGRFRSAGAHALAEEFSTASRRRHLVRLAVLRHFGLVDKSDRQVAAEAHVSHDTVARFVARMRDEIGALSDRLAPRLEALFVAPGICRRL